MVNSYQTLLTNLDSQGILTCTFNRPESRNALNSEMVNELHQVLQDSRNNKKIRMLLFTGSGEKAFVSGADISELKNRTKDDALCQINSRLFREIENIPIPTLAVINGYALGGGMEFAMACDLRICGESARFGQPEVGLGIIPGAGSCYRLPKLIGFGRAKELIFSGKIIDAKEAFEIGLVNKIAPDSQLMENAKEFAGTILKNSSMALQLAKTNLNQLNNLDHEFGMTLESHAQAILFEDPEKHERMQKFLDRKKDKK